MNLPGASVPVGEPGRRLDEILLEGSALPGLQPPAFPPRLLPLLLKLISPMSHPGENLLIIFPNDNRISWSQVPMSS